jgi:hypothetical protein
VAGGTAAHFALGALGVQGDHVRSYSCEDQIFEVNNKWDESSWDDWDNGKLVVRLAGQTWDVDTQNNSYNQKSLDQGPEDQKLKRIPALTGIR